MYNNLFMCLTKRLLITNILNLWFKYSRNAFYQKDRTISLVLWTAHLWDSLWFKTLSSHHSSVCHVWTNVPFFIFFSWTGELLHQSDLEMNLSLNLPCITLHMNKKKRPRVKEMAVRKECMKTSIWSWQHVSHRTWFFKGHCLFWPR